MLLYLKYSIKHAPESLNFQVVEKYLWICATKLREGSCSGKLLLVLCRVLRERFSAFTDDLCEDICTACNYGWHVWWLCHHRGKQEAEWSDTKVGLIWKKKTGQISLRWNHLCGSIAKTTPQPQTILTSFQKFPNKFSQKTWVTNTFLSSWWDNIF